jgi:transcriptional regulator with XRE-family HTH domain
VLDHLTEYDRERLELAARLRELRKEAGLTGVELGRLTEISQSKVSKIETGRVTASPQDVQRIAKALDLPSDVTSEITERAATLMTETNSWRFFNRRGVRKRQEEFHQLELQATRIRLFQPLIIPGLLQTAEYARQILLRVTQGPSTDLGEAVRARIQRQSVLYDVDKQFTFVILEAALRHRFGAAQDQLAQLDRLSTMSTLSNVDIGIVPTTAELPRIPYNSFCIFDDSLVTAERQLDEVIERDARRIVEYVHEFDEIAGVAAFGADGRHVIAAVGRSIADDRGTNHGGSANVEEPAPVTTAA